MLKNAIWIFAITLWILIILIPSFLKIEDLKSKNFEYARQIEYLRTKNSELAHEKKLLEEDPEYLEKVAREKMGLIKKGEVLYRLTPVDPSQLQAQPAPSKSKTQTQKKK